MAYDKDTEKLVKIGIEYHTMLDAIAKAQHRDMRKTNELIIEKTYKELDLQDQAK